MEQAAIIHNDLKPNNILYKITDELDQDGNLTYEIRIADFGTANSSGGTPGWTCPIFMSERKPGRSDAYSTALLILYVMCQSEELFYRLRDNYAESGVAWLEAFKTAPLTKFVISMMNYELSAIESLEQWNTVAELAEVITWTLLTSKYRIPKENLGIQDGMDRNFKSIALLDKCKPILY